MTEERLKEIEARANAATEGPWCWTYFGSKDNGYIVGKAWQDGIECVGHIENDDDFEEPIVLGEHEAATCNYGNPEFIAHSRTDIPDLCAALRAARERIKELEGK